MFTPTPVAWMLGGLMLLSNDVLLEVPKLAPEEGAEATRVVALTIDLEVQSVVMERDGDSQELEVEGGQKITRNWTAKDTFGKAKDGRLLRLVRTYTDCEGGLEISGPEGTENKDESTELDGKRVVFTWDSDAEEYSVAYDKDVEGDPELLEDLQADLDASYLLPSGELEVGEEYEVATDQLAKLIDYGGELHFEADEENKDEAQQEAFDKALKGLTGDVKGTFKGIVEEDGRRLYHVSFEYEVTGDGAVSGELPKPEDAPVEISGTQDLNVTLSFEGTLELYFDLGAKRLSRLAMESEMTVNLDIQIQMTIGDQGENSFAQKVELAGPFSMTVDVD